MLFVDNCELIARIEASTAIFDYPSSSKMADFVSVQSIRKP